MSQRRERSHIHCCSGLVCFRITYQCDADCVVERHASVLQLVHNRLYHLSRVGLMIQPHDDAKDYRFCRPAATCAQSDLSEASHGRAGHAMQLLTEVLSMFSGASQAYTNAADFKR